MAVAAAVLTAVLVSAAGAIGFVGSFCPAPPTRSPHARLLPVTTLAGAVFLVWVDIAARTVLDPQEVPVGVATSGALRNRRFWRWPAWNG